MRELMPMPFHLNFHSAEVAYLWEEKWHPSIGVGKIDFTVDVRNRFLGNSAGIEMKPALQFAAVRTDRADNGAVISNGTVITGNNTITHFQETVSAASSLFFRRGIGYNLTGGGTFASAQGVLYTAFRSQGLVLPAEEIVFNPTNSTADVSYFPLGSGRPIPCSGVSDGKLVVMGTGNLNVKLEWRLAARVFNDPFARGDFTNLESGWHAPSTVDFEDTTGEVLLSGLSPTTKQWIELALAVRKNNVNDANSRCVFRVIPALKYA